MLLLSAALAALALGLGARPWSGAPPGVGEAVLAAPELAAQVAVSGPRSGERGGEPADAAPRFGADERRVRRSFRDAMRSTRDATPSAPHRSGIDRAVPEMLERRSRQLEPSNLESLQRQTRQRRQQERAEDARRTAREGGPEERTFAVSTLDPDAPEDFEVLRAALRGDPDARVRREAALQLGFGPPRRAAPVLRKGLADGDADVVLAAIDSLDFLGDGSVQGDLGTLRDGHPDARVREKAAAALRGLSRAR